MIFGRAMFNLWLPKGHKLEPVTLDKFNFVL